MKVRLSENDCQAIQTLYRKINDDFQVNKIILFGSRARDDAQEYSDIDLLILTNKTRTKKDRYDLSSISADVSIDYGVGLSCLYYNANDWKSNEDINPLLKVNIECDGVEIDLQ